MAEFWANPGAEPKRIFRWLLSFANNGPDGVAEYLVKKASRPSWSVTESTHQFLNHTFYYPGRVEYDEMSVTIVDSVSPNGAVIMRNILANAGYILPSDAETNHTTLSKKGYVQGAGLGAIQLKQLDHDGNQLERYLLHNAWIKNVNLNEVDYESDDLLNIDITLRYDYFTMDSQRNSEPQIDSSYAS